MTAQVILNSRTLSDYPPGAVFRSVRLTYRLSGDRLVWTTFPALTREQVLEMRTQNHGRSGLRWDGIPDAALPDRQNRRMAQSTKEKQEAFRARMAMLGLKEVRGIFLPPELHAVLKEYAQKLLEQHKGG